MGIRSAGSIRGLSPWPFHAFGLAAGLLLSACSTTTGTRESILLHEPVLLDVPAQVGRLGEGAEAVTWEADPGWLLLTPTGLHFIESSARHAVSYNDITSVAGSSRIPRTVKEWPLSKLRDYNAGIEIETGRFNCWRRCVYALESPESAAAALGIIRKYRHELDVFGRPQGPRGFWLTHILRVGPHAFTWSARDKYMEQQHPAAKNAIEEVLRSEADELTRLFEQEVAHRLAAILGGDATLSGWSARSTAGVAHLQSHNPESPKSQAALWAADSSVDRQVVSRNVLQFGEEVSAAGQVSITATVSMSLWFHTVDAPHYLGRTITFRHLASHPATAWLERGSALLAQEVAAAAAVMAKELAAALHTGSRENG